MSFFIVAAFASARKLYRIRAPLGVLAAMAILGPQLGGAKASAPLVHIDASGSAQPGYRKALLTLLATSDDPLSAKALTKFKSLLAKYGWPTVVAADRSGVNAAAGLTLRATSDYALQGAIENLVWGNRIYVDVDARAAAHWIDKINYRHDHKQTLGTLLSIRSGKVVERAPLDKGFANFLRDFNGLPLLEDYVSAVQHRVDLGEPLSRANAFPSFAKKFTPYSNPMLRDEIGEMVTKDQDMRNACAKAGLRSGASVCKEIGAVDRRNLPKEKAIFTKYGFPTARMIGREGVSSFFLLVQHATSDLRFQAAVLRAARPLLAHGDLAHQDYALLDDRVRLAMGKNSSMGLKLPWKVAGASSYRPSATPRI